MITTDTGHMPRRRSMPIFVLVAGLLAAMLATSVPNQALAQTAVDVVVTDNDAVADGADAVTVTVSGLAQGATVTVSWFEGGVAVTEGTDGAPDGTPDDDIVSALASANQDGVAAFEFTTTMAGTQFVGVYGVGFSRTVELSFVPGPATQLVLEVSGGGSATPTVSTTTNPETQLATLVGYVGDAQGNVVTDVQAGQVAVSLSESTQTGALRVLASADNLSEWAAWTDRSGLQITNGFFLGGDAPVWLALDAGTPGIVTLEATATATALADATLEVTVTAAADSGTFQLSVAEAESAAVFVDATGTFADVFSDTLVPVRLRDVVDAEGRTIDAVLVELKAGDQTEAPMSVKRRVGGCWPR